jgi:transposase
VLAAVAHGAGPARSTDEGRGSGPTTDERDELRRLRRENKVLTEEREILRKAAAFFAKDSENRR